MADAPSWASHPGCIQVSHAAMTLQGAEVDDLYLASLNLTHLRPALDASARVAVRGEAIVLLRN